MTTLDVTTFVLLNILVAAIFIFVLNPLFLYTFACFITIPTLQKLYTFRHKKLFVDKSRILLDIKSALRLQRIMFTAYDLLFKLYVLCYRWVPEYLRTEEMKRGYDMAIRAVDNRRVFHYIFEEERTIRDERGEVVKGADDKPKLMPLAEALKIADQSEFTVIDFRGRMARESAEERDRMLEVHTKGGEIVQRVHSGTMDFNITTGGIVNVRRHLAPEGTCIMCGVDHVEEGHVDDKGYFIYSALIEFAKKKQNRKGSLANEIILDHFTSDQVSELANAMRKAGSSEALGEG